jgi:transposase
VLLLGISILQFLDGEPDRAAVEMLKYHAGWNFALNRQLGDPTFHPTTLVNFRQRLLKHNLSAIAFEAILEGLVQAGLVARQSRQRLDSTQMFGRVSRMSRLECVRETLRLALRELEDTVGSQPRPEWWTVLWERYVETKLDYRTENTVLGQKMNTAGLDAAQLLAWVRQLPDSSALRGEQVKLLERVWSEHFELSSGGQMQQQEAQPPGAVQNPHDPEAQWAAKGHGKHRKEHVGYKIQIAETVSETTLSKGEPTANFITAVVTQPAIASDDAGLPLVEQEQRRLGLEKPAEWYLDGAYISAERLAQAHAEGRQLIGPAQSARREPGCFGMENFQVSVEQQQALCPAGQTSTHCHRFTHQSTQKIAYRFEFSTHCHNCSLRQQCLSKNQPHRILTVGQYHTHLQARRQEQRTEAFQTKAKRRNAIEGTQSELVRAHGLRRARYLGLAKAALQTCLAAAACNLKRWLRRVAWQLARTAQQTSNVAAAG